MINRKNFIRLGILSGLALPKLGKDLFAEGEEFYYLPDESAPQKATWMAFGAKERIWGKDLLPEVRRNLADIANAIVQYQPVNMLVDKASMMLAKDMLDSSINLVKVEMDDVWTRDTCPVFVKNSASETVAVNFNFNGWGRKQIHRNDAKIASFVAKLAGVKEINTGIVMEGGSIEVDGEGTAIITESSVLNENRNPGMSKDEFERTLMPLLGLEKIIWLPGVKGEDITDGHVDFYARFAAPGVVFAGLESNLEVPDHKITLENISILNKSTDSRGNRLDVVELEAPSEINPAYNNPEYEKDFAAGYIGYYLCNGAIILPTFGDAKADANAKNLAQKHFPDRTPVQINIDGIAAGGGSIHCVTMQQPA